MRKKLIGPDPRCRGHAHGFNDGIDLVLRYEFGRVHFLGRIAPIQMVVQCLAVHIAVSLARILADRYSFDTDDLIKTLLCLKKAHF